MNNPAHLLGWNSGKPEANLGIRNPELESRIMQIPEKGRQFMSWGNVGWLPSASTQTDTLRRTSHVALIKN